MEKKTIIWLSVGTVLLLSSIGVYVYKTNKPNDNTKEDSEKEKESKDEKSGTDKQSESEKSSSSQSNSTTSATKQNVKPTSSTSGVNVSGQKVSDALLKNTPKSLFGKKVFAAYNNTNVYTNTMKPYTKAKKGQLIGTFTNSTPIKEGGSMVTITSNDPKNKFVVVRDGFLIF